MALLGHICFSVGWLGSVIVALVLAVAGLTAQDVREATAAYVALDMSARYAIVPLALGSLVTGVVQALGTEWGLLRHYWVLIKLLLTAFATAVLLIHTRPIAAMAAASDPGQLAAQGVQLVVASGGGLAVLIVITALSVYKPRGKTRYGLRQHNRRRPVPASRS